MAVQASQLFAHIAAIGQERHLLRQAALLHAVPARPRALQKSFDPFLQTRGALVHDGWEPLADRAQAPFHLLQSRQEVPFQRPALLAAHLVERFQRLA